MTKEEVPAEEEREEVDTLEAELERLRRDAEDYKDKYVRTLADGENARKRLVRERMEGATHAISDVMQEFLQPLDHFENALKHAEASSPEVKNWAIGFEMILTQFRDILANRNIIPFDALGQHFDPHLHEAIEMVETDEVEPGMVIEQTLRGYKMGDRILRAAQVKVAKELEETSNQEKEDDREEK